MELIPLRCTKCGADIHDYNPDSRVAKCTALGCEATFLVEQGRQFADRDAEDAAKIGVLRENLAFYIGHGNYAQVAGKANEILALVPGDFLAQFYTVLAQKKLNDPRGYRRFLDAPPAATEEEYTEAFGVILRSLEVAEQEDAEKYVRATAGTVPEDVRYAWIDQLRGAIDRLKKEAELFDLYPRDVFISYSHVDAALAREVVKCLEQDGVTCWAAFRNLDNTTNANYWEKIRYSVEHCKVFLCIATEASMHSADVTKELDFALLAPQRPKLLEYKADAAPHTTKFKKAFDGLSWINGMDGDAGSRAKAFEQMRERVCDVMKPVVKKRDTTGILLPLLLLMLTVISLLCAKNGNDLTTRLIELALCFCLLGSLLHGIMTEKKRIMLIFRCILWGFAIFCLTSGWMMWTLNHIFASVSFNLLLLLASYNPAFVILSLLLGILAWYPARKAYTSRCREMLGSTRLTGAMVLKSSRTCVFMLMLSSLCSYLALVSLGTQLAVKLKLKYNNAYQSWDMFAIVLLAGLCLMIVVYALRARRSAKKRVSPRTPQQK